MFKEFSAHFLGNSELCTMALVLAVISLCAAGIYRKLPDEKEKTDTLNKPHNSALFRKLGAKDVFWMIFLSVCYAVVSVWNLGSFETISSYWQPVSDYEEIIIELSESSFDGVLWIAGEGDNNSNPNGYQNHVNFQLYGSNDLIVWEEVTQLNTINYLNQQMNEGSWDYRYVKLVSLDRSNVLNEIGFRKTGTNDLIEASIYSFTNTDSMYDPCALLDEQDFLDMNPSYMDETYFDEIYHTRNASEIANHQYMYAYVHPLLGTQLISLGISLFGLSPFGWRIMGALFGILMVPLLYLCALHLFHKRSSAVLASGLLCVEFMHYTTSRIGTLEPFSVFFILLMTYYMLKYVQTSFYETPLKQQFVLLALSGIFMGCACATKFTGVYGGIGLAVLFFSHLLEETREYLKAAKLLKTSSEDEEIESLQHITSSYWPRLIKTGLWCILFFVIVPLCIYVLSYLPIVMSKTEGFSVQAVLDQTLGMIDYHANLDATHPYQSVWWQWILDIRPIWYYVRYNETTMNTISAFGNPLIFWCGAISMLWCFYDAFKNKSKRALWISISYLAQLLPWLLVERCIFIYHYYPSVPFLILGIVHACESLLEKDVRYRKPIGILCAASVVLFVLFLPVIGGFTTNSWFVQHVLRWMGSWYFG